MLKERILNTIKYFDLQDWPLTLAELHHVLLAEKESIAARMDARWEAVGLGDPVPAAVGMGEILHCLDNECRETIETADGFYCLRGRINIISARLTNYYYGLEREKLIRRWAGFLRHIPFVRAAALAGSQALGQQKKDSDIDLLVITDPDYLWLARSFVTAYFQLLGKRRHGRLVANRFCLNHYMSHPKKITRLRNLYTATEYAKLRPLVGGNRIAEFQKQNESWIRVFFPQADFVTAQPERQSRLQFALEKMFRNGFGRFLNRLSRKIQLPRIRQEFSDFAEEDELSFHPNSKQQYLLKNFFGNH